MFFPSHLNLKDYKDSIGGHRKVYIPFDCSLPVVKILKIYPYIDLDIRTYSSYLEYCARIFNHQDILWYNQPKNFEIAEEDAQRYLVVYEESKANQLITGMEDPNIICFNLTKPKSGQKEQDICLLSDDDLAEFVVTYLNQLRIYYKETGFVLDVKGDLNVYFQHDFRSLQDTRIVVTNSATKYYLKSSSNYFEQLICHCQDYTNHLCDLFNINHIYD